jgi:four helix bundle protein
MTIQKFEDIIAWQKAQDLAVEIYSSFSQNRDYGFRDQIFRAVVSISNNIAEGFERAGDKEFSRFIHFSLGSCSEVKSMLYLSARLNYVSEEKAQKLIDQTSEIAKMIHGLNKHLRNSIKPKP